MNSDNDITLFAKTNFRNREVPFGIRRDDRRRHVYVIGKTGMGKTTMIENMVVQDIQSGHGVAFVDPHGDSVERILDYIPSNRVNDVVYFNPADIDYPIAFNPLEAVDPKYKHLVASGLMGVFTKIWAGVWSARMEYILNNTILALLDSPGNTLLGIARMLVNRTYRKKIVDNIKDPVVRSFWVDEFANYNDKFRNEAIAPIQNKVGQFLSSAIIRNIVGQTKSTIDLRDIMDNKKIFLINLSKGRIGEDNSALLGAMLITKLQLAAMSRVDIPEEEREDFYLYVDEFQNFATTSFANILSEARKYRLNLIVAHQYINQLVSDRNTIVRDAIFGNVGTMICFRVGADDAEYLETEFEPTFTPNDLLNLPKYNILLKLMINGVSSNPFSATTLPPISVPTQNEDKVIKVSRERYANDRSVIEEKINKWMGAEFHAEVAMIESKAVEQEDLQGELRYRERVTTGPASEIRATAPLAPKVDRKAKFAAPISSGRASPIPASTRVERGEGDGREEKREDRRKEQRPQNPGRRAGDQPRRTEGKKQENPVWETINKMTQQKVEEEAQKAVSTLESKKPEEPKPKPAEPKASTLNPGDTVKF
ncbi:MAG: type IV secretion system DNA-binding domain-containing protein [Candidatus Doudnabacteria bacterium]|nr:type IV secretion system DNA-binding domain-containing protein [Candidatus Doudnabacteria bacterium]